MTPLHTFTDNVSRLSAQTVETRAHRFHSGGLRRSNCASSGISTNPSKFYFSNPTLLAACRRHPDSRFSVLVNNGKAPLSLQINNVTISNRHSSKRIYDLDCFGSQDELGFNPKNVNQGAKKGADNQISNNFKIIFNNPKGIESEKRDQYVRSDRPGKVTSRSKGFIHHLSIAGEGK